MENTIHRNHTADFTQVRNQISQMFTDVLKFTDSTAFQIIGVQKLLDAIIEYMPAPTDIPDIKGVDLELAKRALTLASHKLPVKTVIVVREGAFA